ncbi:NAD-dependent protein deacylase [Jeongeupia sp. USM3]|uniref:NAD-dependent protein deacylase n=1 Tax=Jeongeupia sp. USM3 TaxID=1906741 RepID=UPI00089DE21B|nr:NAD-dependent protein deacylase [Jeongeupia sp. USM3]AOX99734.1 NAD-dependent protein deacylase [Jeongeupia sp. USM3]
MTALDQLADDIRNARHIAVLSGAGMSTESGIPDFRSANGLFTGNRSFADVVSIDYFMDDAAGFWAAFREIFKIKLAGGYQPNAGHTFLAALAQHHGKRVSVLTQNIDGLHHKAGSDEVLEMHGSLMGATCLFCHTRHDLAWVQQHDVPRCRGCGMVIKPDVVLYGEAVPLIEPAFGLATQADLLIVMGSSLEVGPVNLIPLEARRAGVQTALINLSETRLDHAFDVRIEAGIGDTCRRLADLLS